MLMKTRPQPVDFCIINPKHEEIHKRLENWSQWCRGGAAGSGASPMFQLYRPDNYERASGGPKVDGTDAQRIVKALRLLPLKHQAALNWFYVKPVAPGRIIRVLALTMEGLAEHVQDGRQMLINIRA